MAHILIKEPGLLTTVQDKGRFGKRESGMSCAGAMDTDSLRIANMLVANNEYEAALEATIIGPKIEFVGDAVIAVSGADLSPRLDSEEIRLNQAYSVKTGQVLSFGQRRDGCRTYIAFAGGLDTPVLFGSRSTLLRNKIGGIDNTGRPLRAGDAIMLRNSVAKLDNMEKRCWERAAYPDGKLEIRVVLGPQDDCFTEEGIQTFLSEEGFLMTDRCNRQGYRLQGNKKIEHVGNGNIVSDGIALGAIQVPPDGAPIIMMAEAQSTGGYTKIANVITDDLAKLAQAMPGTRICFKAVDVLEAQAILAEKDAYFKRADSIINHEGIRIFRVTSGGYRYRVTVTPENEEV